MSALELVTLAVHGLYLAILALSIVRFARRPSRINLNIVMFFTVTAMIIVQSRIFALLQIQPPPQATTFSLCLLMTLPYLLLLLLDNIADAPAVPRVTAFVAMLVIVAVLVIVPAPAPPPLLFGVVATFFVLMAYAGARFVREARRSQGASARRFQAIALGATFVGLAALIAGLQLFVPRPQQGIGAAVQQLFALGSAVAFFIGFAPPTGLWRAWQEPELRASLSRAASLPRLPDTASIVRALEDGAARSTGARASIGLAQDDALVFLRRTTGERLTLPADEYLAGRAFTEQRPVLSTDPARDDPAHAETYREAGAGAVIAAPITAGERRLGVLAVYAPRPPAFAETDIELVRILADQAAVILESRALIDEATRVRAQEEATRLKDDFLSAAAHDLRTPLTTLVAQAQYLERQAIRDPAAPADLAGVQRIVREAKRLSALVSELLDVNRLERGQLVGQREPVDLVTVAAETAGATDPARCRVDAPAALVGTYDPLRIRQLLGNLVENALKYSPGEMPVTVSIRGQEGRARISVGDRGIGIPPEDLPHVFERFRRGSNVDDRRFAGMGLGLYLCRGIVEQHGGLIWAESEPGRGTTIHVDLPLEAPPEGPPA